MLDKRSTKQKNYICKIVTAISFCLIISSTNYAEFTQFDASYKVRLSNQSSDTLVSLKQNENSGVYAYSSFTKLSGLFGKIREESIFTLDNGKVTPTYYLYDSEDDTKITYNWNKNQAVSKIKKGRAKITLKGMELDLRSLQMQISRDLKNDNLPLSYRVIHDNGLKTVNVINLGEDTFEFNNRSLKTVMLELQRKRAKSRQVLWIAPELDYLLVKMQELEGDRLLASLDLDNYNNLTALPVIEELSTPEEPLNTRDEQIAFQ